MAPFDTSGIDTAASDVSQATDTAKSISPTDIGLAVGLPLAALLLVGIGIGFWRAKRGAEEKKDRKELRQWEKERKKEGEHGHDGR